MTTAAKSEKRLVEVRKVARIMDVDPRTVRKWCAKGDVQAVLTPGGRGVWRVWVDEDGIPVRR